MLCGKNKSDIFDIYDYEIPKGVVEQCTHMQSYIWVPWVYP